MNRLTGRTTVLSLLLAVAGVALAWTGPPPEAKAPGAKSSAVKEVQALKSAAAAKRPAPRFVSGLHAGIAGATALVRPDLINVIPRVGYDQFAWTWSDAIMKPVSPCGFKTYFRVMNHSSVAAGPSLLKLECQFVPNPTTPEWLADSNITLAWWGSFVCGQITGWKSLPALRPGETSAESEAIMAYVLPGPCTLTGTNKPGYPRVRFTADGANKVDEGTAGENNNLMWVSFCY